MKSLSILFTILIIGCLFTYGQKKKQVVSGKSEPIKFASDLIIGHASLEDENNNNFLDANERASIKLSIVNSGNIPAKDVLLQISLINDIDGLKLETSINAGDILVNETKELLIPLTAGKNLPSDTAVIRIRITDKTGTQFKPFVFKITTHEIPKPYVYVEKAMFNSNDNFKRNNPIYLKLFVKNSGDYIAKDVKVNFNFLFKDCFTLSDTNLFAIGSLKMGESKTVDYIFTANSDYLLDKISLKADLTESNRKYARDTTLSVKLSKESTYLAKSQLRGGGDPLKGLNISKATKEMQIGNYFSLIIGIDNYKGNWMPLNNAVRDAKAVENILKTNYKFNNFRTLYNEFATRENIIKELEWLVENVKENDNVFIYYSGHGEFKKELKKGYWIPVDAEIESTYDYVSNSDIQTFLAAIKSKHTLLISDACFSGDIFRGKTISVPFEDSEKYYQKVHNLKSRQAITSGGIEPVMDGGSDGHSVFAYYLLKALKNNETKYYDAGQLYNDIKIPVTNNSDQSPILQPIKNTGDEGGQFLFIKK